MIDTWSELGEINFVLQQCFIGFSSLCSSLFESFVALLFGWVLALICAVD